jgi:hypothetical protein
MRTFKAIYLDELGGTRISFLYSSLLITLASKKKIIFYFYVNNWILPTASKNKLNPYNNIGYSCNFTTNPVVIIPPNHIFSFKN